MDVWRPCDAVETAAAWGAAIEQSRRPDLPGAYAPGGARISRATAAPGRAAIARGGYVLIDCEGTPEAIVIATGSEVGIAAEAVSSMRRRRAAGAPGLDAEHARSSSARTRRTEHSVLPPSVARRVAVEAGAREPWWRYVGLTGQVVGIDHFGASAPAQELFKHFGFTAEHVQQAIDKVMTG